MMFSFSLSFVIATLGLGGIEQSRVCYMISEVSIERNNAEMNAEVTQQAQTQYILERDPLGDWSVWSENGEKLYDCTPAVLEVGDESVMQYRTEVETYLVCNGAGQMYINLETSAAIEVEIHEFIGSFSNSFNPAKMRAGWCVEVHD